MSSWLEIAVRVPVAQADEVGAAICDELPHAAAGTEIRSDRVVFWVDVADGERALADTRVFVSSLAQRGFDVDPARVAATPAVPEDQWRDAWKRYFKTIRLTRRIVVVPSWDEHSAEPDDVVIYMDPGQAFGTGDHATTRLMLEELQALADRSAVPVRVADIGTGSGILSVAAAKLWPACRIEAVDIDPLAVAATIENCERNSVANRVRVSGDHVAALDGPFDLILANIQAGVLTELAPDIASRAASHATVVLSGLLSSQAEGVGQTYAALLPSHSRTIRASDKDPQWSCAVLSVA